MVAKPGNLHKGDARLGHSLIQLWGLLLAADELRPQKGWLARQAESVDALLHPFSDPAVNAKLIALCVAQALCSVATLIHDTYLPIYLQDVLGLSNTKVPRASGCPSCHHRSHAPQRSACIACMQLLAHAC